MAKRVLLLLFTLLFVLLSPFPAAGYRPGDEDHPYDIYLPQIYGPPPGPYGCEVVSQMPTDDTVLNRGQTFDMNWMIKNTSGATWPAASTDIRFVSGDRVHIGNDVRDIGSDVIPNGMISIIIPMAAPSVAGRYVSNWSLSQGKTSVCRFYVRFEVGYPAK